ncbi:tetratricopeptide repeat protein [Sphingosinithalassobacter portus]|uniref:tetratricopeptide repeat protein n=1 Tax=Stakelama portus TaxID=2676234 RepID=UPI00137A6D99|nr:tetratricopeptide repeat protein [Sphingosinithalassobacter portus]
MQVQTDDAIVLTEKMIDAYPEDARLHFLRGSILAGAGRPIEAHASLSRAVALAPDFALARFQLGFFELTSGEAQRALATWEPLGALPDTAYLRRFAEGLAHLIRNEFVETVLALRSGIDANEENLPLNNDMQLIIDECEGLIGRPSAEADEASATSLLLGQFGPGRTH